MEHPHDPYHVRPFPQQPKRGGKELVCALNDLETALTEPFPDLTLIQDIQSRIHRTANLYNDDRLVNLLLHISEDIDSYRKKPERVILEKILRELLKVKIELKHL